MATDILQRGARPVPTGRCHGAACEKNATTQGASPWPTSKPHKGKTQAAQEGEAKPRLPHEHDQSSDSQQTTDVQPPEVGRQALKDIERGLVDTDRAPVTDRRLQRQGQALSEAASCARMAPITAR